jgi:hypothetical protein
MRVTVRSTVAATLCALGGLAALVSLFGMWGHLTLGPAAFPGLEVGVGGLLVSAASFCGWYWYGT